MAVSYFISNVEKWNDSSLVSCSMFDVAFSYWELEKRGWRVWCWMNRHTHTYTSQLTNISYFFISFSRLNLSDTGSRVASSSFVEQNSEPLRTRTLTISGTRTMMDVILYQIDSFLVLLQYINSIAALWSVCGMDEDHNKWSINGEKTKIEEINFQFGRGTEGEFESALALHLVADLFLPWFLYRCKFQYWLITMRKLSRVFDI